MGCSSSDSSNYIIEYCCLYKVGGKENIYKIKSIGEENVLKIDGKKFIDQMGKDNNSPEINEFLTRSNFKTHTIFYFFLRGEPIIKNYEQSTKYFPYNLPLLSKVILLNTENEKNYSNLSVENKTKSITENNFIGSLVDFSDLEKIMKDANNSIITKDSLSLSDEDIDEGEYIKENGGELIICEEVNEETFKRITEKFKNEQDDSIYLEKNAETSNNIINNINNTNDKGKGNKIKVVKIINSYLEDLVSFSKIMKFISNKNIKKFIFIENNINADFEGWDAISSFFEENYILRYLDLHSANIYDYNLKDMMRALFDKRIRFLNLSENFITSEGAKDISEFLKNNKTLQKLNLSRNAQCQFKKEGVKYILDGLILNKNIESIDFSFMNLTGCGEDIGNFITHNKSIENIILKNVLLNINDFKNIFIPVKNSKTLKEIDISMNDMGGDKSLQYIADALKENCSLESIKMDQININDDNYHIIFEAIEQNKTITKYSINYNSNIKPKIVINFFIKQKHVKYLEYQPFDKENPHDKNKELSLEEKKLFEKFHTERPDMKIIYK